ncbi:hypothetical protein BDZ94DRAFT_1270402 [Collybia nuda]|uniref:Uncharacterized protein n=1 Tax=Collybia nuda TaxID=64659 RepID=A0A9P6CDU0_9AGAR|nr:hypothetical protein BDZ94DRAFT_1270402 [Collybia nuda]
MNLNACPPELHSYICQLACVDDGITVRALSLVSRYYREIARPFVYQSVAISGTGNVAGLVERLEATPAHLRHIRHLFIADQASTKPPNSPKSPCAPETAAIVRVLSFAAPTVETLSFVWRSPATSTMTIARLFRLRFPRLRELTVSGFYPFLTAKTMPSLERLHLHGNRNPHGLLQMGSLDDACPSLTHLRVSGLSMAVSFVSELQEAFSSDHTSPFPATLSSHVQQLIVQPAASLPASGKPGTSYFRDQAMMDQLQALKPRKDLSFEVLERPDGEELYESFRRDWKARLEGGLGCWL